MIRISLLMTAIMVFTSPSFAQGLSGSEGITVGSPCSVENQPTIINDDGDKKGILLVCNSGVWAISQPTFAGTCADNRPIVYDNASGGLRCGPVDTIDPIWVTPAGTITTTDVNLTISEVVAASDESGTPTYNKVSGAAWLSVASDGRISGKAPAAGGTYSVVVRATDGSGNTANRTFDVVVNAGSGPVGCVNPGDICADGTIYAGKSPDGDVDYYTTQVNAGSFYWNGGGSGFLNVAITDCTNLEPTCRTGEANTNNLILLDSESNSGFQAHNAALACFCLGEEHANAPDAIVPTECSGNPVGTNGTEGHGHDDWYLPSIAELDVVYVNLRCPGDVNNPTWEDGVGGGASGCSVADGPAAGTLTGTHWTSSENNSGKAWMFNMGQGTHELTGFTNQKNRLEIVRCVRK